MSTPPVSSADTLALLRNTGPDGIDATGFQADRLVLQHRVVGGVDADALARALAQSQAFRSGQPELLLEAVQARIGTADRRNLADALATSGAAPGLAAQLDRTAHQLGANTRAAIGRFSDAIGDSLAEHRRTLQQAADDPDHPDWLRSAADLGSRVLGKAQEQHGIQVGGIRQAADTARGVADTVALAERFVTDADFRQLLLSTARLYAEQTIDDPSKPGRDLRNAAVGALQAWAEGLQQAERAGRRDQYLGETTGAIAFDAALAVIPLAKLSRLGRVAEALDRTTPDGMAAAAELAADAGKAAQRGGPEARAADAMLDDLVGLFRRRGGRLDDFVQAAKAAGQLDDLLLQGRLHPKEVMTLATRQPEVFQAVTLDEAFDAGVRRLGPVTALKEGPLGDLGEAIVMRDLMREGHAEIHSLQNRSGWGVDVTYRNKDTGMVDYIEVKSSAHGIARNQSGDPQEKINDWLNDLVGGDGHWKGDNVDPNVVALAKQLKDEIQENGGDFDAYWARINLSNDTKTGELIIDKRVDRWLTPEDRALQRQQNKSAAFDGPFDDVAFNNVYAALQSGDDRAVRESLDQLLQSPQAEAIMAQGSDALRQKELEEQRIAQEWEAAMQATTVAQTETRSGYSR